MRKLYYLSFAFKKQGLLFLIQMLFCPIFAQQSTPTKFEDYGVYANLDSLEKAVYAKKDNSIAFLNGLITLEINREIRSDKFGQDIDTIKVLAQKQSSELGLMMYEYLRSTNFSKNNLEEGMRSFIKLTEYFEHKKDTIGMLNSYQQLIQLNLSASGQFMGSKDAAKVYLNKALELGKNSANIRTRLFVLKLKAVFSYALLGVTDISTIQAVVEEAMGLINQNPEYEYMRSGFYGLLGFYYNLNKMPKEQLEYSLKSYQFSNTVSSKQKLLSTFNLGTAYYKNLNKQAAEKAFMEAKDLYIQSKEDRPELNSAIHSFFGASSF